MPTNGPPPKSKPPIATSPPPPRKSTDLVRVVARSGFEVVKNKGVVSNVYMLPVVVEVQEVNDAD